MRQTIVVAALMLGSAFTGAYLRPEPTPVIAEQPPAQVAEEPDQPAAPPAVPQAELTQPAAPAVEEATPPIAESGGEAFVTRTVAAQPAPPNSAGWVYTQPAQPTQYTGDWVTQRSGLFGRQERRVWVPRGRYGLPPARRLLRSSGCAGGG